MTPTEVRLSILTLNCWGILLPNHRQHRMRAIGQQLLEASPGYDIVGLQEVWAPQDFILIREIVKDVLPYSKLWTSGLFGSGLATFSRHPIVSSSLTRFALNGDPWPVWQGDWYDGKSCGSVVVTHPLAGEIEVFNTHYHATYHPVGTDDPYLGARVSQAWEMSKLFRQSTRLGRRIVALGDFNSPPRSIAVATLTRYGRVTDSWGSLHPLPQDPLPRNLTPAQGLALLGITCDTPLNSWTPESTWVNEISRDPIGERLDYIFYNASEEFKCLGSEVVLKEKVPGVDGCRHDDVKEYTVQFDSLKWQQGPEYTRPDGGVGTSPVDFTTISTQGTIQVDTDDVHRDTFTHPRSFRSDDWVSLD
ncbi:phospholipase C type enzyme [Mortierella sp. AD032]|nr:phospholipase C type enzyme [Mortierella sp. AD032]